jgi:hypothetical protein
MIVVIAGAGASTAVHERYKTTAGFLSSIPQQMRGEERSLFNRALHHVKKSKEGLPPELKRKVDIEEVLGWLDQLATDIRTFGSLTHLVAMWDGGADVKKESHTSYNKDEVNQFFGAVNPMRNWGGPLKAIEEVTKDITSFLWAVYAQHPEQAELAENWHPLIRTCLEQDPILEVFTLNYDPVIEAALESSPIQPTDGFTRRRYSTELDVEAWRKHRELTNARRLFFTKLHGSLDWTRSNPGNRIVRSGWQRPASTNDYILIPPILKKQVLLTEPFKTFYERLDWAVENADHVYTVGYAHRDPNTNAALKRSKKPVCVVNRDAFSLEPLKAEGIPHRSLICEKGFCIPAIGDSLFTG